jgi:lipopolysaccharide export system permease protein
VVLINLVVGEYVVPHTERIAQSQKAVAQGSQEAMSRRAGFWHREGNIFMHFNAVEPKGVLHGVTLFEFDEARWLTKSTFAQRATFHEAQWQLENIIETHIGQDQTRQEIIEVMAWETDLSPAVLGVLIVKPDNLSIQGLYTYSRYLLDQDLNATNYLMAFWKKVLNPVATAVLVLVAISFIFGPLRSVTMGFRVFAGSLVGLVFKYAQDLLGPSSLVFGFNPIFATLVPIVVCLIVGVVLLRRAS